MSGRTRRLRLGALLIPVLVLAACGTADSTPGAGVAIAQDTAAATPIATSTATPSETSLAEASPAVVPTPTVVPLQAYVTSLMQIEKTGEQLTRQELSLVATGADEDAIVSQAQADLPARQELIKELQNLTPPDEFKTFNTNLVALYQKQLDAQQQILQGKSTGDQTLIDSGAAMLVDNQWTQAFCAGNTPQQAAESLGFPAATPEATPVTHAPVALAVIGYVNAIQVPLTDMANQYRSLCAFNLGTGNDKATAVAQLKQVLPAISRDIDGLAKVIPPDALSEYHQLLVAGYQKMVDAQQLAVQGYEQNDPKIDAQSRVMMAEAELKLLDAQDALVPGLMNAASNP